MDKIVEEDAKNIVLLLGEDVKRFEGKTVLVTGGAGFLGSYFLEAFAFMNENTLKKHCKIICVDNLIVGKIKSIEHLTKKDYFSFVNHDLVLPLKVDNKIDFIIHAASIASPVFYRKFPLETIDVNIAGTRNMLELAKEKKVESFLYTGTSEVYGDPPPEMVPSQENYFGNVSPFGPRACYDESKRLGETLTMEFFRLFGTPVKITRTFNAYGPKLHLEDRRVIPEFVKSVLNNEPIPLLRSGKDTRSFCYVTDNITGQIKVLLSGFDGEIFNVGNPTEEITMLELAERIKEISGLDIEIIKQLSEDKNCEIDCPKRRCPDITKIREKIGWTPKISLTDGLKRTIEWHKINSIKK